MNGNQHEDFNSNQLPGETTAFFDLDHTLLARSSGELYVQVLREQGLITRIDITRLLLATILYKMNLLNPDGLMERVAMRYAGESEKDIVDFCQEWFHTTVKKFLYTDGIDRIRDHQAAGHHVALLTAATPYIAEPTGHYLGIEHILCTRPEVKNGLFTGRIKEPICHGKGKLFWANRFCEEMGIELKNCYFYTDSVNDMPVLDVVGHPRPVNPDFFLKRAARKKGWPISRFKNTLEQQV